MSLNQFAAQSGLGGIVYGRSNGGGVAPGNATDNAYYVPPDPYGTFRDNNGRISYANYGNESNRGVRHHQKATPGENPMVALLKQMMGMPLGKVGNSMMQRTAEAQQNLQWRQIQQQAAAMRGRPGGQMHGQGGLDRVNPYIGPQSKTQAPFWGNAVLNQQPGNF